MAQTELTEEQMPWELEILLVEEDHESRVSIAAVIEEGGHRVHAVADAEEALALATRHDFDVAIADVATTTVGGLDLLTELRRLRPDVYLILTAASPNVKDALTATRARADYQCKPLSASKLLAPIAAVARRREAQAEYRGSSLDRELLLGHSPLINSLRRSAEELAEEDDCVLITGEAGTGKALLARHLHNASARAARGLFQVQCKLPPSPSEALTAQALFAEPAHFERIEGGTLVLEDIDTLPFELQWRVMAGLESGHFLADRGVDLRLIATTSRDLATLATARQFRSDLANTLCRTQLHVPRLDQHLDDLPLLVEYFCRKYAPAKSPAPRITPQVWAALVDGPHRGNVRELEDLLERALAVHPGGELRLEHLTAAPGAACTALLTRADQRRHGFHFLQSEPALLTVQWRH